MKKLTVFLLSIFLFLAILTSFKTTRAMLIQAAQTAATLRYAQMHLVPREISVPFIARKFTLQLPTIKIEMPRLYQPIPDRYTAEPIKAVSKPRKKSPISKVLAGMALALTTEELSKDSDSESSETVIIKKDKMADEAEPILEEVFAHLQIKSEKNIWQTLNDAPFEQQDKILSSLMNILMDPTDKRSFKAVVYPGLQCTKLWEKYPALHKLISTHFQKPKAQQFLDEFNALEDEQLPPQFAQARLKICEVCNKLSMWQKGKIWWKF